MLDKEGGTNELSIIKGGGSRFTHGATYQTIDAEWKSMLKACKQEPLNGKIARNYESLGKQQS